MPRARANSSPSAPARLLMTALTGRPASISARMLLPRPEIRMTSKSVRPGGAVAVVFEQREDALLAVKVQRTEGDERLPAAQLPLHAERHDDAAVVHHALGHHGLVRRDLRIAPDECLAQPPDRRQVALEVRLEGALGELEQLVAVREAVLEQRHLRLHRELVEGENLLFHALDLVKRHAPRARQLEKLAVERRAVLGALRIAQVEQHPPGLQLVHHLARQADRAELLHRAFEILRADLLLE